jgi:hypothetical protein
MMEREELKTNPGLRPSSPDFLPLILSSSSVLFLGIESPVFTSLWVWNVTFILFQFSLIYVVSSHFTPLFFSIHCPPDPKNKRKGKPSILTWQQRWAKRLDKRMKKFEVVVSHNCL